MSYSLLYGLNHYKEKFKNKCERVFTLEIMPEKEEDSLFSFPQVTRIEAQTIAQNIVSVLPMQEPTGQLFYLDYRYNENNNGLLERGARYIGSVDVADRWNSIITI